MLPLLGLAQEHAVHVHVVCHWLQVMAMEAEAESTALLVGNDKLENKFAALEAGSGVAQQRAAAGQALSRRSA